MNMEKFQATIDRFTDLKKTLSFIEHESPGTSPQLPRRGKQLGPQTDTGKKTDRKTGRLNVIMCLQQRWSGDILFLV